MKNSRIKISEGIELLHIQSDKFKTVNIALLIRQKLHRDDATKNALIPQLLRRGSVKYPTLSSINIKAEELYGAVFDATIMKKGEEQIIQFYMEILNENIEKNLLMDGLKFMRDIVLDPLMEDEGFNKEFMQSEKENLSKKIKGRINDKKEYAKLRMLEKMCEEEPFGIYGDGYIEDLEKINNLSLYDHYKKIISESIMEFIIIGDCDAQKVAEKIKKLFVIKRTNMKNIEKTNTVFDFSKKEKFIKEKADISQAKLCIGLRCNSQPTGASFYETLLMNEIFGGGPESKLFIKIREQESLCYYINSYVYRFKSIMVIQSGIDEKNCEKTVNFIKEQLEEMKKGKIKDAELSKAKKGLIKKFNGIFDHPQAIMDFYLAEQMLGEKMNIDETIKNIEKVTKEAVVRSAEKVYIDTIYLLSNR